MSNEEDENEQTRNKMKKNAAMHKKRIQTLSTPQLSMENPYLNNKDEATSPKFLNQQQNHTSTRNVAANKQAKTEDEEDLYLNSNNNNNKNNANVHHKSSSNVAQGSLVGTASTGGGFQFKPSTSRPEKLFSSKLLLNQRALNNSNRNIDQAQQQQLIDEPNFLSNNGQQQQTNTTKTREFDSADTNSANSQLSLNSGSQSTDYLKGAILNKKLNGMSTDPNQILNELVSKTGGPGTNGLKSTTVAGNMSQLGLMSTSTANKINDMKGLNQSSSNLNEKVKIYLGDKSDGTMSDSALTTNNVINGTGLNGAVATNATATTAGTTIANTQENPNALNNKKRRPSMAKALVILGLSKKSNSASNLALGKRFGFARSEEYGVTPELRSRSTNAGESSNEEKPKPRYVTHFTFSFIF